VGSTVRWRIISNLPQGKGKCEVEFKELCFEID